MENENMDEEVSSFLAHSTYFKLTKSYRIMNLLGKDCARTSSSNLHKYVLECRGSYPVVKCTYCRTEFQQNMKGLLVTAVCRKCDANVKAYGKPSACEYCNIIAAFIGNKCQRCTNTEKKYGPPVACEQCKQKCAFDRKDEDKKIDGKVLCWLCTLSYKRALAKTKKTESARRGHLKVHRTSEKSRDVTKSRSFNKRPQRVDVTKVKYVAPTRNDASISAPPAKIARTNSNAGTNNKKPAADPNSSDHVVAMTQLKEQIVLLQKQLSIKDCNLLSKDKYITELKAKHFTIENDLRNKMKTLQKEHESKVEMLVVKLKALQKELAVVSKSGKKNFANRDSGSSGSRTNSPLLA